MIKKNLLSYSVASFFTYVRWATFVALGVANDLFDQVFVCQVPVHCIHYQHDILISATNTEWVFFEPARTHNLGLKIQHFENPFGCFALKAVSNTCKLKRFLQVTKFLFIYAFTSTNIVFLSRQLPTKIFIFIKACYQTKCLIGDSFSFFGSRFWRYSSHVFGFKCSSYKVFKDINFF